jgi:hypothetical protein
VTDSGPWPDPDDPNKPEHAECPIQSADRLPRILFIDVPDGDVLSISSPLV